MASILSYTATVTALLLFLYLFLSQSLFLPTYISSHNNLQPKTRRNLLSLTNEEDLHSPILKSKPPPKKQPVSEFFAAINKTKSLKPKKTNSSISSSPIISNPATKSKLNKTISFTAKFKLNKTLTAIPTAPKAKLNKTSITSKSNNNTKLLKPIKFNSTKISLPKSNSTKPHQLKSLNPAPKTQRNPDVKDLPIAKPQPKPKSPKPKPSPENWLDETEITGDDDDIIAEFRDLPSRLHSAIVPDLHKLSATSKLYLSKTHREIAAGVKPFVGKKYAPSIASAASAALLLVPLLLVTALFRHLLRTGSSASLHRALLFVQAYLAIYFATLSLTAVVTGLEPLRFFHAASPGAYAWTQAVQTFGYVVYLIAQLIALVVAFSADDGEGSAGKAVNLAQMLLGLAVGMHYYITVFHRAVTGDAPRANWKVHGIYAACFVVICGLGRADRRKKAYTQDDGGDDGKKS
ncbi:uncharacterized protein LOC110021639 [Phalaenopsis equestris]|uniref:uncharacterized protein LOC110021639 n=1 Tax=Phalaenopsis equestris TaxID=78828 RepID=UPI0009E57F0A|nr:uncharacterized protein LOC110021639 [Phalaenopsis equestris]